MKIIYILLAQCGLAILWIILTILQYKIIANKVVNEYRSLILVIKIMIMISLVFLNDYICRIHSNSIIESIIFYQNFNGLILLAVVEGYYSDKVLKSIKRHK